MYEIVHRGKVDQPTSYSPGINLQKKNTNHTLTNFPVPMDLALDTARELEAAWYEYQLFKKQRQEEEEHQMKEVFNKLKSQGYKKK